MLGTYSSYRVSNLKFCTTAISKDKRFVEGSLFLYVPCEKEIEKFYKEQYMTEFSVLGCTHSYITDGFIASEVSTILKSAKMEGTLCYISKPVVISCTDLARCWLKDL